GRERVTATAELLRDATDVHASHGTERDAHALRRLLQNARDVGLLRPAHQVDETLRLLDRHAEPVEVGLRDPRGHESERTVELGAAEAAGDQLEVLEPVLLEQLPAHA